MTSKPTAPAVRPPRRHGPGGATLGQGASAEARRLAAAILEVLAGARSPAEAATALGVSLVRYYQVEARALRALVAGCEARPRGRAPSVGEGLLQLRQGNARRGPGGERAVVRGARGAGGLAPPRTATGPAAKKGRRRRQARALSAAARLQEHGAAAASTAAAAAPGRRRPRGGPGGGRGPPAAAGGAPPRGGAPRGGAAAGPRGGARARGAAGGGRGRL